MKKITFLLLFIGFTINAQVNNYSVGDVVDDFTVTDIDGVEHNLYSITAQGKYVWLDFFFADCVPCQQTAPIFNEFFDKYGCNEGLVFCLSINNGYDDDDRVRLYEQQHGGPFNHAPAVSNEGGGPDVDANFGVSAYPTYCLIGPDNTLVVRDIWPLSGVETFEATFPAGFEPAVMECTLGITESEVFNFEVYPTISNGNISINLPSRLDSSVAVFNTLGQQVFANNYTDKNISLNLKLAPGVYLVKVTADASTVTKRIIIQ
ncbi:T9SS type A sorting domain-containing protein [Aequorivita marisscotiae]|uniref:T9SS type A sorting domain-containing protein n=2 Tax=Aequorivita TaxID=153265 RepID=A0ABY8KUC9_9FLAO|nr:T9SS type A sorting domain-containing protein [Aequorivita sp. Ant34-E75]WGF92558.1 T9SS type A sorting domain-containing protein [Aequorivita sp. Ant34-E75]